jgi:hypothetical protein
MTKQDLLQIKEIFKEGNDEAVKVLKKGIADVKQEILDKVGLEFIKVYEKIDSNHEEAIKFAQEQTDKILKNDDAVAKELKDNRQEQAVIIGGQSRMDGVLFDHGKRIIIIENKIEAIA